MVWNPRNPDCRRPLMICYDLVIDRHLFFWEIFVFSLLQHSLILYLSSWIIQNQRVLPDSDLQHRPKSNCCFAHSWPTPDPSLHITSVLCTEFLSGPRQVPAAICLQKKFWRRSDTLEASSFVGRFWVTCRVLSCLFYGITGKWW